LAQGPQLVTRRGAEAAMLVPVDEWRRLTRTAGDLPKALLLAEGARSAALVPARGPARRRKRVAASQPGARGPMYLLDTNVVSELRKPRPPAACWPKTGCPTARDGPRCPTWVA
jgi:PHD/YefM family antitoxin component YafN of YafNO toxin-antitoxin module